MQPVLTFIFSAMETQNFEKELTQITKPEITGLKYQDMLADAISNAKDKSVISWWWLSVPIYIIIIFYMKSVYMPHTTLISNLHELTVKEKFSSFFLFLILPVLLIIINLISVRKIYFLSGRPRKNNFLRAVWSNVSVIIFSILILIIYSL